MKTIFNKHRDDSKLNHERLLCEIVFYMTMRNDSMLMSEDYKGLGEIDGLNLFEHIFNCAQEFLSIIGTVNPNDLPGIEDFTNAKLTEYYNKLRG